MAKTKKATFSAAIDIFTADLSCLRAVLLRFLPTNTGSERARRSGGQKYQTDRGRSPLRTRNVGGTFFAFGVIPPCLPLPCSVLDDVTAKNAVSKGKGRRGREHADDDDEDSAREKEREKGRKWLFFLLCIQRPSPSRRAGGSSSQSQRANYPICGRLKMPTVIKRNLR